MSDGVDEPVRYSRAGRNDLLEEPENIVNVEVTDEDGEAIGYLISWSKSSWFYADDTGSYVNLDDNI